MRAAVVLIIFAFGLGAAAWSRFAALLLYLWFALFRPLEWAWFTLYGFRYSLIVGMALVIPAIATGVWPNLSHPLSVLAAGFVACALLAQMNAPDPATGWIWVDMLARSVLMALLLTRLTDTRRRYVIVLAVVAGSLGFHSAKAGVSYLLHGGGHFTTGPGGAFYDNNDYAMAIVRILFLLIAVGYITRNRLVRIGAWAAVPLSVLTVVGTYSRGAFLGLVAGTICYLLLQRRRLLAVAVVAAGLVVALKLVPIADDYYTRIESIRTPDQLEDASAQARLHFWRTSVDMAMSNPLGVGLRNFEEAYDKYDRLGGAHGSRRSVHSSHFQVLAETGFGGFVMWMALIIWSMRVGWAARVRSRHPALDDEERRFLFAVSTSLMASLAAYVVAGSFLAQAMNELNWITFALFAALDLVGRRMVREAEERQGLVAAAPAAGNEAPEAGPVRGPRGSYAGVLVGEPRFFQPKGLR